jgi:hypothetical protein
MLLPLVKEIAAHHGVEPADIVDGVCGHSLALVPSVAAERMRDVERAIGLPAGGIVGRLLCDLIDEWRAEPGQLLAWVDRTFEFTGTPEERANIGKDLYRLEVGWREVLPSPARASSLVTLSEVA